MASKKDEEILNSILHPFFPIGQGFLSEVNQLENEQVPELSAKEKVAQELEVAAVAAAEAGDLQKALELLDTAATTAPEAASIFNNRAQVYRLMGRDEEALADLNKSIELGKENAKSTRQALCQRALLYNKADQQDLADRDLSAAASLGSPFAKLYSVQNNPYAALCNQMMRQVMSKLHDPQ